MKFAWEDFLESLSVHLSKVYGPMITLYMKRHSLTAPKSPRSSQKATRSCETPALSFEEMLEKAKQAALGETLHKMPARDNPQNYKGMEAVPN